MRWILLLVMTTGSTGALAYTASVTGVAGTPATISGTGALVLVPPAGATTGDVLVATVVTQTGMVIAPPPGWTGVEYVSANGLDMATYYLVLTTTPAASYAFSLNYGGNNIKTTGGIVYARGASTSAPLCANKQLTGASGTTITAPAVGYSCPAGSLQLNLFGAVNGNSALTPASGTAGLQYNTGGGPNGTAMAASWRTLANTGDSNAASASNPQAGAWGGVSIVLQPGAPVCFSDSFNRASLGPDWVTTTVSGAFTPGTVTSPSPARVRLTDNLGNESTAMTLQRLIPAANGVVEVTLKFYAYGQTNPADGVAVILSDAAVTPQAGGFGGSLGYVGFAGGWLGAGLDEYGNFSSTAGGHLGGPGRTPQSVSIRGSGSGPGAATTAYRWIAGTGSLSPTLSTNTTSTTPSPGYLYRVTVDSRTSGKSLVTIERDTTSTGSSYSTLLGPVDIMTSAGQVAAPANLMLSFAGSTGGKMAFHEIGALKVCANAINPITTQIDHIRFLYTQQALTCQPSTITVKACMDAACTATYSGNLDVTLSPTGWVGGDAQTINGAGSVLQLFKPTAGTYTLDVAGTSVPLKPYSAPQCWQGGVQTDCSIVFNDAGLVFSVPNFTSGQTTPTVTVSAMQKTSPGTACVPAFANVTRNVGFWSTYTSPATGTMNLAVSGTNVGTAAASATTLPLSFNASGQASINVSYPDAGQMTLNAKYTGSAATSDAGLALTGNSTFVVSPAGLCVDSPDANWNCAALSPACTKFKQAGQTFNLRVSGRRWVSGSTDLCSNPVTPNYQQLGIPLTSTVLAPAGGVSGALGVTSVDLAAGDAGSRTISNQTESDVGVFRITATPGAGAYFGVTVPGGSGTTGRFYPAGFAASSIVLNNRSDLSCAPASSFTYLGEPLNASFALRAVSAATGNPAVFNYFGSFALLSLASPAPLAFAAQQGTTSFNSRLSAACSGSGGSCGTWTLNGAAINADLTVARNITVDGPYASALFGLSPVDSDGVRMLPLNFSSVPGGSSDGGQLGTTELRYGRMRLTNAYGTGLLGLSVPASMEYYNGSTFVKNTADNCTTLAAPASVLVGSAGTPTSTTLYCAGGLGFYPVVPPRNQLSVGSTTLSVGSPVVAGSATVKLSKPGASGYVDLAFSVPNWLKFNWDGVKNAAGCTVAGADLNDDNPRARIRFGAYRNPSIIFMGESY
ncbi:hypothetical protein GCM10025771_23160 [Niveibacterium umoris]|uniref:DUF6701 domain-containing protein n=1 Tax=Niveibacterium umoris TaxID=1193620 RepID=UPI001612CEBC|nr:DUF6701 domain-containing protein [Niveibacterium umoris]